MSRTFLAKKKLQDLQSCESSKAGSVDGRDVKLEDDE